MADDQVNVNIQVDITQVTQEFTQIKQEAKAVGDKVSEAAAETEKKTSKASETVSKSLESVKKGLSTLTDGLKSGVEAGINYNATIENYETSFGIMTGSAEKAADMVDQLKNIASNSPLELSGLVDTTQSLMNYGLTADEAIDRVQMLGDVTQGNADKLSDITTAYGEMTMAGKVSQDGIDQMITAGFNPLQEISEATGESMESLTERIGNGTFSVDEITSSLQRSTSEGGKYFDSMEKQGETFDGQVKTLKDSANSLLGEVVQPISDSLVGELLPAAIDSIGELQTGFEQNGVQGLIDATGNIIAGIAENAAEFAPQIFSLAGEIISQLAQGFIENLPLIITSIQGIADTVLGGIGDMIPGLSPITDFLQFLVENLDTVLAIVLPLVAAFAAYQAVVSLTTAASAALSTAQDVLTVATKLLNGELSLNPLGIIIGLVVALVAAFLYLWNTNEGFRNFCIELWNSISSFFINAWNGIVTFCTSTIPTLVSNIGTWISDLPGVIWTWLLNTIQKVSDWEQNLVDKGKSAIVNLISNITNTIKSLPDTFVNIGGQLISGLWNGINNGIAWLKDKIKDLGNDILSTVKGIFGIHSPSRKFAWIGKMCVEGFEEPFEDYDPYDTLTQSMKENSLTMKMNYAAGLSSASGSSNGFNYEKFGSATVDAFERAGLKIDVNSRELGRVIRGVVTA